MSWAHRGKLWVQGAAAAFNCCGRPLCYYRKMAQSNGYIESRFAVAAVRSAPFPHLVIDNVFPDELYRSMKSALPSWLQWRRSARNARTQPMFALRENNVTTTGLESFPEKFAQFQAHIELVDRLVLAKFASEIDAHLAELREHGLLMDTPKIGVGQSVFCQRGREWFIEPHVHDLTQLTQVMIYFPLPLSSERQGTVFYSGELRVKKSKLFSTVVFPDASVGERFLIPYKSNRLLAFLNTPRAIHSSAVVGGMPRRYIFTGSAMNREVFNENIQGEILISSNQGLRLSDRED